MDSSREIRAMMMASFPCPPLPMEGSCRFVNSHDMLAYLVDVAARRSIMVENLARQRKQETLIKEYIEQIVQCETEEATWTCMTMFTRMYMMSYHTVMHEARFLPFDAVAPPLRRQVCSWLAAQHIMQGDDQVVGSFFENLAPWPLYERCKNIMKNDAAIYASREPLDAIETNGIQSSGTPVRGTV